MRFNGRFVKKKKKLLKRVNFITPQFYEIEITIEEAWK